MPNQINASGKLLAGLLLTLFLLLPVIALIGYWPDRLPKEKQCSLYNREMFHVHLLSDSTSCAASPGDTTTHSAWVPVASRLPVAADTVAAIDSPGRSAVQTEAVPLPQKTKAGPLIADKTIELSTLILFLVAIGGFLGAMIHVSSSFVRYVGADEYVNNWLLWYVVKPFVGTAIALIGYLAFEGKILGNTDATQINLYRIIALAILTGMFTDTATDKLQQIFETIFIPRPAMPDGIGKEAKITGVKPEELGREGETNLLIQGTNLKGKDLTAQIDGVDVKLLEVKDTSAMIKHTPTAEQLAAGKVMLQISDAGKVIYKVELKIAAEKNNP